MRSRRRFLQVLGATAVTSCVIEETDPPTPGSASGSASHAASSSHAATSSTGAGMGGAGATTSASSGAGGGLPASFTLVGHVKDLKMGTLACDANDSLLLGVDQGGVYAMTSICTHQGCDMCAKVPQGPVGEPIPGGFQCNCHGSQFDLNGGVINGPADQPLQHFKTAVDAAGAIGVDMSQPVGPSFRAPLP